MISKVKKFSRKEFVNGIKVLLYAVMLLVMVSNVSFAKQIKIDIEVGNEQCTCRITGWVDVDWTGIKCYSLDTSCSGSGSCDLNQHFESSC